MLDDDPIVHASDPIDSIFILSGQSKLSKETYATRAVRRGRGARPVELVADEEPPALSPIPEEDEQVEVQVEAAAAPDTLSRVLVEDIE